MIEGLAKLNTLRPDFAALANKLVDRMAELGATEPWRPIVSSAFRDPERQERLYRKGRQLVRRGEGPTLRAVWVVVGKPVTNARPWESAHCFGLAVDIPLVSDEDAGWIEDTHPAWHVLECEALALGLETGNRWPRFRDAAHVQMPGWKELCAADRELMRERMMSLRG